MALIFGFGLSKQGQKREKQICNEICKNYSYNYFHVKISVKLLVKPLLNSVHTLITWITKLERTELQEHPQQILSNFVRISWRASELLWFFFFFWGFHDFLIYLAKYVDLF